MKERIRCPSDMDRYPIWAWYQSIDENNKRPVLRSTSYFPAGTYGYRIEMEKEEKDVLLSDFELWHTPLACKRYIADSEEESLKFESELIRRYGTDSFLDLPDNVRKEIEKSWEKVLDLDYFARPFKENEYR